MAGGSSIALLVAATIAVTILLAVKYPRLVRDSFLEPIESARTLFGLAIGILAVWYALNSGVAWMMGLALLGVAFVTAYVYFEEPHNDIR